MPRPACRPAVRRAARALGALLLSAGLAASLGACSGGDDEEPTAPASSAAPSQDPLPEVRTTATLGRVTGDLARARRAPLRLAVRAVVDRWIDAAYIGGSYPRGGFKGSFPGFADGAAREARKDLTLLSNAALGERLDEVRARRRSVALDVLARDGRPVGVTAHVLLAERLRGAEDAPLDRVDRVRADLYLTRTDAGWRVFGYDVDRGTVR